MRECVNKGPVAEWGGAVDFSTNGASRLWQCLPGNGKLEQFTNPDPFVDLMGCCEMTAACNTTMTAARTCATEGCIPACVKTQAQSYMNCIVGKSRERVCNFAGLCVGQLTGSDTFDFVDILSDGADSVTGADCSPMEPFVDDICDISNRCCKGCNSNMGSLASCLVNELLLPNSMSGGAVSCQISTPVNGACAITGAAPISAGRDGGGRLSEDLNLADTVDIDDCEEALTFSYIVHNVSYAVDEFMTCIGKKTGQVLADAELEDTSNSTMGSSATTVFGSALVVLSSLVIASSLLY